MSQQGEYGMRSDTEYFIFLRRVPLFKGMTGIQLRQLTAQLDLARFRAGEVIFAEGEPSQHFYIIMSGRVRIVKAYGKPDEQILATLGKTDFFGDMGILESKPGLDQGIGHTVSMLPPKNEPFNPNNG